MIRNNLLILTCISIGFLQGCTNYKTTEKKQISQNQQSSQAQALQQCVHNADVLVKLNKNLQKDVSTLYVLIADAKFYASVSGQTSANVKSAVTPLFEYKINERCNSISQKLITEFEKRAKKADYDNGLTR